MSQQTPPPPPPAFPPVPPQQPPRSWWGRNWKWVVPVGCLTPMILCGGLIALIVATVFGAIKSSEPYKQSVARVQESAEVQEMLGTPIEPSFWVAGSVAVENDSGNAEIVYTVSGPNGQAVVQASATKSAGVWTFDSIQVQEPESQQMIDLVAPSPSVEEAMDALPEAPQPPE